VRPCNISPTCGWACTRSGCATVDLQTLNELFLQIQPAHLQKLHGERLSGEQRSIERAAFIRARLSTN